MARSGDWLYLNKARSSENYHRIQKVYANIHKVEENHIKHLPLGNFPWHYHITSMSSTLSQSLESLVTELRALESSEPACLLSIEFISLSELGELLPN